MFFFTYLARELRRRVRQAIFIALGLAVGVGLVLTVTAAAAGVKNAQASVLKGLYGVATDITVTVQPPAPSGPPLTGSRLSPVPGGDEECRNGKCIFLKDGTVLDELGSTAYSPISATSVTKIAALHDVTAAAGGLLLLDVQSVVSANPSPSLPTSFTVDGTDVADQRLGPLSDAVLTSGRSFTTADADKDVALVDENYATANRLKAGGTMKVGGTSFTIIGLVAQPGASSPLDVYIPLARAQALGRAQQGLAAVGSLKNDVSTVYVTAASGANLAAVQQEIAKTLPAATITTPSGLANEISGSLTNAQKLANELGKWLSILVLIAAFAVAVLLTMAAVARRVREFGTLKALGWPGRRIIAQVMGESLAVGITGAAVGVGLGFAGAAIINAIAPKLSAFHSQPLGAHISAPDGSFSPAISHTVLVPLTAAVSGAAVAVAVLLALGGGLLAGTVASWRIGRLRPADAIAKVA
ncbi:MAG TPA: ABC transporter permease [Streptosporangiaceae bacterium]|nr:ABC transporter permease [Streptosporangiaceae bacterium]